jgi:hypothetical protein
MAAFKKDGRKNSPDMAENAIFKRKKTHKANPQDKET